MTAVCGVPRSAHHSTNAVCGGLRVRPINRVWPYRLRSSHLHSNSLVAGRCGGSIPLRSNHRIDRFGVCSVRSPFGAGRNCQKCCARSEVFSHRNGGRAVSIGEESIYWPYQSFRRFCPRCLYCLRPVRPVRPHPQFECSRSIQPVRALLIRSV